MDFIACHNIFSHNRFYGNPISTAIQRGKENEQGNAVK